MTSFASNDGVRLHVEQIGRGRPVVFVHEFGGDCHSWEPQIRYLGRQFHCVAFNARGYPPSDVPDTLEAYTQDLAGDDIGAVMDHLSLGPAHLVGLSMGSAAVLNFALRHPDRVRSITLCGAGYGSIPEHREAWLQANAAMEDGFLTDPRGTAERYAQGPTRVQYKDKDPRGWAAFVRKLENLSGLGAKMTLRGVQARRPGVMELEPDLVDLDVPALIVVGDEDEQALEPSLFLKRRLARAGLWVVPKTGHAVNLEEPTFFNQALERFLLTVDAGGWPRRNPAAIPIR